MTSYRGKNAPVGAKRQSDNGYWYIKCDEGWRLLHHVIAEKTLKRKINTKIERVIFINGDRRDLRPQNIEVKPKGKTNIERRRAQLEDRIRELQAQLDELNELEVVND